jgi:hypothetical protein
MLVMLACQWTAASEAALPSVAGSVLSGAGAGERTLVVQDGDGAWKAMTWSVGSVDGEAGRFRAVLSPRRESLVQRDGQGDWRVLQQDVQAKDLRLVYDDPILWLPATITAGQTFEHGGKVRQLTLDGKLKRRGQYTQRVTVVGPVEVTIQGQSLRAWRLEQDTRVTLGWVQLTIRATTDYVEGQGLLQQEMTTLTRAYGVFGGTAIERLRPATAR